MDTQPLSEIYLDYLDEDSFVLGRLVLKNNDFFLFETVNEYGNLDSFQLTTKSSVTEIISQTDYTKMFDFVIDLNKKQGVCDPFSLTEHIKNFSFKTDVYQQLELQNNILSFITEKENF